MEPLVNWKEKKNHKAPNGALDFIKALKRNTRKILWELNFGFDRNGTSVALSRLNINMGTWPVTI